MQVGVGVLRHVVVEHDVDALNVHAATEQVGGDQDALERRQIFILSSIFLSLLKFAETTGTNFSPLLPYCTRKKFAHTTPEKSFSFGSRADFFLLQ